MNKYTIKINKNVIEWIFVLSTILFSGNAYAASVPNVLYVRLKYIIVLLALLYMILIKRGKIPVVIRGIKKPIEILCIWIFFLVILFLIHYDTESLGVLMSYILNVIFAYIVVCIVSWKRFMEKYVRALFVISLVSLVCFFWLANTDLYRQIMPILQGMGENGNIYNKYQGILIYFSANENRNFGCFWEPGIFATHIIIALLSLIYCDKVKRKTLYFIIFSITLFSTSSSAGYVIYIFVIVYMMLSKIKINIPEDWPKLVLITVVLFLLVLLCLNINSIIVALGLQDNLVYAKLLDMETSQRYESIIYNLKIFLEHPFVGVGFEGINLDKYYLLARQEAVVLDTATSFRLLATMGFAGAFFTYIFIWGIIRKRNILVVSKIILIIIVLIVLNKEGQDTFLLPWTIAFYLNEKMIINKNVI